MKKAIIIGGGMAGYAAGIYLQANGYQTLILEKNAVAGGACIGWERQGCYIDGCIHWFTGTNPKSQMYKMWRDLHALRDDVPVAYQDDLVKVRHSDGTEFIFYADPDKMEKELIKFAPEDTKEIKRLARMIRRFQKVDPPVNKAPELMHLGELLNTAYLMGGVYGWVLRTSKISARNYGKRFKNQYLRDAMKDMIAPHYNYMSMLYMLGHISWKNAGIPLGGSLAVIERMENRYLELGGEIRKGVLVTKVNVEKHVAKGVTLRDGTVLEADWVVATTPIEHTFTQLLRSQYTDKLINDRLKDANKYPIYTFTTVAFKCPISIADKTTSLKVRLDKPFTLDRAYSHITFRNYAYDTSLKGSETHCVIQGTIHSDDEMYYWWRNIKDNKQYKQEKERVAQEMLAIIKKHHPDVADEIEVIDVVTPCTYERYLNSRHGSFQGFIHTQRGKALMQNGRVKGLDGFILAGQWIIQSGGLPAAAISGKYAAQRICKSDKKKFVDFD